MPAILMLEAKSFNGSFNTNNSFNADCNNGGNQKFSIFISVEGSGKVCKNFILSFK